MLTGYSAGMNRRGGSGGSETGSRGARSFVRVWGRSVDGRPKLENEPSPVWAGTGNVRNSAYKYSIEVGNYDRNYQQGKAVEKTIRIQRGVNIIN